MIITCPSCSARYPVDAAAFPPAGRKVRCAKCGETWHQAPPDDLPKTIDEVEEAIEAAVEASAAPPEAETPPVEEAPDNNFENDGVVARSARVAAVRASAMAAANARRSRTGQFVGWGLLILFLAGSSAAIYGFRTEIVRIWPASAALYAAFDEPINVRGMEFQHITYEHQFENGLPILAVSGQVVNIAKKTLQVPRVRVGLRDANANELYHWTFALPERELKPSEVATFVTRLSSPPLEARDLEVRFLQDGERQETALD